MQLRVTTQCESRGKFRQPGPAAAAVIIHNAANGRIMLASGFFLGNITQEEAEFQGLLRSVEAALSLGGDEVQVLHTNGDVIALVTGAKETSDPIIEPLLTQVQLLLLRFDLWQLRRTDAVYTGQRVELIAKAIETGRDFVARVGSAGDETMASESSPDEVEGAATGAAGDDVEQEQTTPRESETPVAAPASNELSEAVEPAPAATASEGDACDAANADDVPTGPPVESIPRRSPCFDVQLAQAPGDDCPHPMKADEWHRFGPATPPGVCIYAAREVLNQTLFAQGQSPQWLAECSRCGVWIQIARVE